MDFNKLEEKIMQGQLNQVHGLLGRLRREIEKSLRTVSNNENYELLEILSRDDRQRLIEAYTNILIDPILHVPSSHLPTMDDLSEESKKNLINHGLDKLIEKTL